MVIRSRREHLHLSQEAVAGKAAISVQMLRRVEAGTANPTLGSLHAIAGSLNANVSDLLREADI